MRRHRHLLPCDQGVDRLLGVGLAARTRQGSAIGDRPAARIDDDHLRGARDPKRLAGQLFVVKQDRDIETGGLGVGDHCRAALADPRVYAQDIDALRLQRHERLGVRVDLFVVGLIGHQDDRLVVGMVIELAPKQILVRQQEIRDAGWCGERLGRVRARRLGRLNQKERGSDRRNACQHRRMPPGNHHLALHKESCLGTLAQVRFQGNFELARRAQRQPCGHGRARATLSRTRAPPRRSCPRPAERTPAPDWSPDRRPPGPTGCGSR